MTVTFQKINGGNTTQNTCQTEKHVYPLNHPLQKELRELQNELPKLQEEKPFTMTGDDLCCRTWFLYTIQKPSEYEKRWFYYVLQKSLF